VEAAQESDEMLAAREMARELNRHLDRLGAGVGKERIDFFLQGAKAIQPLT
jgi:hypothetical protein